MSLSNSRYAYTDCYAALDAALDDPRGGRLRCADYDAAMSLRARLHYARIIKRRESEQTYEPGDPRYGVTVYDTLVCRIKNLNGTFYVYIEHRGIAKIERLSEVEDGEANGPDMDGHDLVDDLAASVIGGDRGDSGDGDNGARTELDERPVRAPEVKRRL